MAARKHHGIYHVSFGTSADAKTELAKPWAAGQSDVTDIAPLIGTPGVEGGDASMIEFLDQEGNPLTIYGNKLAGVQMVRFVIRARDVAAFDALTALWDADTPILWRVVLDNLERWHNSVAVYGFDYLRQTTIQAVAQGVSDQFECAFMIPLSQLTRTTT